MHSSSHVWTTRAALLALAGAVCSRVQAQSTPIAEIAPLLGMSVSRHLEIAQIASEAEESGDYLEGMAALAGIARISRDEGDHAAWVEAELEWVRLAGYTGDEGVEDALEELTLRAREWALPAQEADAFAYWSARLEDSGQWLSALRAQDAAAQAALGGGLLNRGLDALLEMSRLCRVNNHPWRLQAAWVRISQIEQERPDALDTARLLALEEERALALPLLAAAIPQKPLQPRVDLQPSKGSVQVSKPHGEIGRTKLFLTNETLKTVKGSLSVTPAAGEVKSWSSGVNGQWVTLGPQQNPQPRAAARDLSLRPGERLSLYVEREQPAAGDAVNILWESAGQKTAADISFFGVPGLPESSITNAGSFTVRPGWPVPLYHELNFRGPSVTWEDFQFSSSIPCRLEIFDADSASHSAVDAGSLLAVDAEGDGSYEGPDDRLFSDTNKDKKPDILIGDRSRSLELYAWPLRELPDGEEITITARLRDRSPARRQANEWRREAVDTVRE